MVVADLGETIELTGVVQTGNSTLVGDVVITGRDSSRSARMLKRAVHAGLNAAGVSVQDLEVAPLPVTRFVARRPAVAGAQAEPSMSFCR